MHQLSGVIPCEPSVRLAATTSAFSSFSKHWLLWVASKAKVFQAPALELLELLISQHRLSNHLAGSELDVPPRPSWLEQALVERLPNRLGGTRSSSLRRTKVWLDWMQEVDVERVSVLGAVAAHLAPVINVEENARNQLTMRLEHLGDFFGQFLVARTRQEMPNAGSGWPTTLGRYRHSQERGKFPRVV